jgi:hypothetical protein
MTLKTPNPVSSEIDRLAKKFGYSPSSIAGKAFKNSRKAKQLKRRDTTDAQAIQKLKELEVELEQERQRRVAELYPDRLCLPEINCEPASIGEKP